MFHYTISSNSKCLLHQTACIKWSSVSAVRSWLVVWRPEDQEAPLSTCPARAQSVPSETTLSTVSNRGTSSTSWWQPWQTAFHIKTTSCGPEGRRDTTTHCAFSFICDKFFHYGIHVSYSIYRTNHYRSTCLAVGSVICCLTVRCLLFLSFRCY